VIPACFERAAPCRIEQGLKADSRATDNER